LRVLGVCASDGQRERFHRYDCFQLRSE
jgi:hypothetical protein